MKMHPKKIGGGVSQICKIAFTAVLISLISLCSISCATNDDGGSGSGSGEGRACYVGSYDASIFHDGSGCSDIVLHYGDGPWLGIDAFSDGPHCYIGEELYSGFLDIVHQHKSNAGYDGQVAFIFTDSSTVMVGHAVSSYDDMDLHTFSYTATPPLPIPDNLSNDKCRIYSGTISIPELDFSVTFENGRAIAELVKAGEDDDVGIGHVAWVKSIWNNHDKAVKYHIIPEDYESDWIEWEKDLEDYYF